MFIINAPLLFVGVWEVIKALIDPETIKKIKILGSDYLNDLLGSIDRTCIPDFLGGTCKCLQGCANSDIGPWNDGTVKGYPILEHEKVRLFKLVY
jgi:hypothetical protein